MWIEGPSAPTAPESWKLTNSSIWSDLAVQEVQPWLPFENYNRTKPKKREIIVNFPHSKLMEVQSPAVKRPYDITMSRRTRKQQSPVQGNEKPKSAMVDVTPKDVKVAVETTQTNTIAGVKQGGESDHKSLKQLIIGDDKEAKKGNNDERSKGSRNSLGEHFTEEEKQHLQLVRIQQKDNNLQGLKFKKLVSRYAKVLGHLMKAKRDPHLSDAGKKPIVNKKFTKL
ncbi:unnamed protein product [Sphenostylis stenocarpa]|uniref:Uncharacterized protein n=1 Tax=Sphenostylis stenocarpa TaxID=92480 RepID=A0AA86SU35_9FABA|nr:unnamed protein product [Sphenostylis stenocarpa]